MALEAGAFWWFDRKSAGRLARQLVGAFVSGTFARLEVRPYVKDGVASLMLVVVRTDAESWARTDDDPGGINDSLLCPPICPGGGGG